MPLICSRSSFRNYPSQPAVLSTLKEAINIKQNIFMLPMLTEQKQLELESRKNPTVITENEIRVILEDDTDKYCN